MATKTDEEVAREAFKQELLHTSNWGLRRLATGPKGAGIEVADMKKADETGPEAVVELILEKYDEGWRPGGPALNPASKPDSTPKTSSKKAPPKEEKESEPEAEATGNPWDDVGNDGGDVDIDGEEPAPETEPEPDPEPEPEPEKPKRQRRTTTKTSAPAGETSALEEKVDKVLDTMMKFASVISKFEKTADSINGGLADVLLVVTEIKEINTVALGGLFNRLSIKGYGDVVKAALARAKKACGAKD